MSQPFRGFACRGVPSWFLLVIAVGLALRAYLVVFTPGTYDVGIWQKHATGINDLGLIGYYHANLEMNHPPLIGVCMAALLRAGTATGIPFRVLLRAPFALLDLGTCLLLLSALRLQRFRFAIAACYFLHPLALIYSAYHGNTDSAVAFFLVLSCLELAGGRPLGAALAVGACTWIKLPILVALPAFFFAIPGWRKRAHFLLVAWCLAFAAYLPALLLDPGVILRNVVGYQGQMIQTPAGVPVWGAARISLSYLPLLPPAWRAYLAAPLVFWILHNGWIYAVPIVVISFLRRKQNTFAGLSLTVAAVYSVLYGFSNYWSFQYFAWSVPFWLTAGPAFAVPASLLAGGYIYGLYWFLCGDFALSGPWDFLGHPHWSGLLIGLRNLSVLFFFLAACVFLVGSVVSAAAGKRGPQI
jgi:hypothetical protein